MNNQGFTGLAFPMRLNARGGLKMTTTSPTDFTHIEESIRQILQTNIGERVMENYFGSQVSSHVFDPSDDSSYSLIRYEIVETLKQLEPRVEVLTEGISLKDSLDEVTGKNFLHVTIQYKVIKYNKSETITTELGG